MSDMNEIQMLITESSLSKLRKKETIESHQLAFDFVNYQVNWELVKELAKAEILSTDQSSAALIIIKDLWAFHEKMDELLRAK